MIFDSGTPKRVSSLQWFLGAILLLGASQTASAGEFLVEPTFKKGAYFSPVGTISKWGINQCNNKASQRGVTTSEWTIVDICDGGCLCRPFNLQNPTGGPGNWTYSSPTKTLQLRNTEAVFTIDSSDEHNGGCSLAAQGGNYSDANREWYWHHFLLASDLRGRDLDEFRRLRFTGSFRTEKLNQVTSACNGDGQNGVGLNLRVAFKLAHKSRQDRDVFAVFRVMGTEDGRTQAAWDKQPFMNGDPDGTRVYIQPALPSFNNRWKGVRQWEHVNFDVRQLAREALAAYDQLAPGRPGTPRPSDPPLKESDYKLVNVTVGLEIFGGYDVQVRVANLSLFGGNPAPQFANWKRYYSAGLMNHFNTLGGAPNGYARDGVLGKISKTPGGGMVPLYRYYHPTLPDHHYSLKLLPFGVGGRQDDRCRFPKRDYCAPWEYYGLEGYVYPPNSPNRRNVFEMWHPAGDHMFTTVRNELGSSGYICAPNCNAARFSLKK